TMFGSEVHLLYHLGGFSTTVELEVSDAKTRGVKAKLRVQVEEVNDPPVIDEVIPVLFEEDEPASFDLSPYIYDEDDLMEDLVVECDHPSLTSIEGFTLTFLFTEWREDHDIMFTVLDGEAGTDGVCLAQVRAVNDPPIITGIGDLEPPFTIELEEGMSTYFQVSATDEDSPVLSFSVHSLWTGIDCFYDGSLRVNAGVGEVGEYTAYLTVDDMNGGMVTTEVMVVVTNVNDPPSPPSFLEPEDVARFDLGAQVTFEVDVDDPDMMFGQVLTVTWTSNISGPFMTRTTEEDLMFITDTLPLGTHRITVTVTDGEFQEEAVITILVVEPYVPPPPRNGDDGDDKPSSSSRSTGMLPIVAIAIVVVLIVVSLLVISRRRSSESSEVPEEDPPSDLEGDQ
ncbi:MAG: hypothetical protein KAQ96_06905, partial [Thermoplasmata archaeon]|nr:hypothetical protein [Thermoplasmata archaeon]